MSKPRSLADAVDKVARQSAGKNWGLYANLLGHWTEIAGPEFARVSTPIKIAFPYQPHEAQRKNGILTVRLPKGLSMEFSFKSEIIRHRINAYFGYEAFARIVLDSAFVSVPTANPRRKIDPATNKRIKDTVAIIKDDSLRSALENFGTALFSRAS